MKFRKISINGKIYGDLNDMENIEEVNNVNFRDCSLLKDIEENNEN